MSESRRKLWLYLYPDEPYQEKAIDRIESIPLRQRPDFFRDCLISGIALSTLDNRIPSLLALLLDGKSDAQTLKKTLSIVLPEIATHDNGAELHAVAWQKRVKDQLAAGTPWTAWIAITEEEYKNRESQPDNNAEFRALFAQTDSKTTETKPIKKPEPEPEPEPEQESETLSNAKRMFNPK